MKSLPIVLRSRDEMSGAVQRIGISHSAVKPGALPKRIAYSQFCVPLPLFGAVRQMISDFPAANSAPPSRGAGRTGRFFRFPVRGFMRGICFALGGGISLYLRGVTHR